MFGYTGQALEIDGGGTGGVGNGDVVGSAARCLKSGAADWWRSKLRLPIYVCPGRSHPGDAPECRSPLKRIKPMTALPPRQWRPDRSVAEPAWPVPSLGVALARGAVNRCPACGQTKLFCGFLTVEPECRACGAPLGAVRADDAPPYFTIFIVLHVVVLLMLATERSYAPPEWVSAAIFLPLAVLLTLLLIRPVKGATVGLMLKLGMMKPNGE
jgi:uncharacterized protein (DUF983 family)